ncbi:MAG: translation elongation factor-like protein [Candidatus Micrarchaeota archaeon]|nr:translation elongation factor-like protein [Candidatus Micrarchaeota archaeon]
MEEKRLVGKITHFFDKIGVAVIELSANIKKGDKISIEGATTNFIQDVESMQIDHKEVAEVMAGQAVGMKMSEKVRAGDQVFKISS